MRLRRSTDGSLFAPHRGKPPACPDGYEQDPMDPYRFVPILDDCEHRTIISEQSGCCGKIRIMKCAAKNNKVILKSDCLACEDKAVKISIIIQNDPPSRHLEKLLQSLYRQQLDNMEIIIHGGDVQNLCEKYEARYNGEPTGQIWVTTYSRIYQLVDCIETLVAPILEDVTVNCFSQIHIDKNGQYLKCLETGDFDNLEVWKQCPETDYTLLSAKHRSSAKGNYVKTDAWAIDLGD